MRAVVRGEEHERLPVDAVPPQPLEQSADVAVHTCDHGSFRLLRLGPVPILVDAEVGHLHTRLLGLVVSVRDGVGQVEEEGAILAAVHEGQGLVRQHVMAVIDLPAGHALPVRALVGHDVPQGHSLLVAEEEGGVVVVRVALVQVAEEGVEALPGRHAGGALVAQAPLADEAGGIPRLLELLGDGNILRPQIRLRVAANEAAAGVQTGHQHAAGGGADGGAGIELGEPDALRRHPVQVRRPNRGMPVAAEIAVAEIVREDDDDVWSRTRLRARCCNGADDEK